MDEKEWLRQFNWLMADRGEMKDFHMLEPESAIHSIRKSVGADRNAFRRDVMTKCHILSSTGDHRLDFDELLGPPIDDLPGTTNKYSTDDYRRTKAIYAPVIDILEYEKRSINSGDEIIITMEDHLYSNQKGIIVQIHKGKYLIEIISKSVPNKSRSITGKAQLWASIRDFKKTKSAENEKEIG